MYGTCECCRQRAELLLDWHSKYICDDCWTEQAQLEKDSEASAMFWADDDTTP